VNRAQPNNITRCYTLHSGCSARRGGTGPAAITPLTSRSISERSSCSTVGEKDHWLKYALWEQSCRVFLSIRVPGCPVQRSQTPVSLIDVYPTLQHLCSLLSPGHELDGVDLSSVLAGRATERGRPVLSTYGQGNHAIRDARYRYIRYRNGEEELYDHETDPYEWTNVAGAAQ
jgi:arylsulfatase A-like enzyme